MLVSSTRKALLALAFQLLCITLHAQTFDATNLRQPTQLEKTWLVHAGDDPAYALPGFDDSHWLPFDDRSDLRDLIPNASPSVVWYRIHIKVSPDQHGLALEEVNLSPAFEIYANGAKLIQSGSVVPFKPYTFGAFLVRPIPDAAIATGTVTIALRVFISQQEWRQPGPGLYATNLTLGQEETLSEHVWLGIIGRESLTWVTETLLLGVGLIALVLFASQRNRREYLYIFLFSASIFSLLPISILEAANNLPLAFNLFALPAALGDAIFMAFFVFAFLQQRVPLWMWICLGFASTLVIAENVAEAFSLVSSSSLNVLSAIPLQLIEFAVLPILAFVRWRKGNREAGIILIPLLAFGFSSYMSTVVVSLGSIRSLSVQVQSLSRFLFAHKVGPFNVSAFHISEFFVDFTLAIIILLRATETSRRQTLLESELAAAAEVQQVMLPQQMESLPGFTIESVYLPAQQVGGDFFQTLPSGDGGMLLVVGDVAGKGLPAAMLVSVLVGAIRGVADYTRNPAELLANLNERLIGRSGGGFTTALIANISNQGAVTIANAGHLSPYLDGHEVELPGALPLGIASGSTYATTEFHLPIGSRLTFYSDGIVEAQKPDGELFGFDRAQSISTRSADTIASTAQAFGQEDDITVITIQRQTV